MQEAGYRVNTWRCSDNAEVVVVVSGIWNQVAKLDATTMETGFKSISFITFNNRVAVHPPWVSYGASFGLNARYLLKTDQRSSLLITFIKS
jgi:hypothetical protein